MGTKFTDPWSLTHFAWGYLFSKSNFLNPFTFLIGHTIFEIWENSSTGIAWFQKMGWPRYLGDNFTNSLGDTFWAMAGFYFGEIYG